MKKYILASATLIFSTHAWTQKTSFIELKAGPNFPIGKFAEKGLPYFSNNELANPPGTAKTGLHFSAAAGHFVNKKGGVMLSISNSQNRQNSKAFRNALQSVNPGSMVTVRTKYWSTTSILGGVFVEDRFTRVAKLSYHLNLQAGIAFTTVPGGSYFLFNPQTFFATKATYNKRKLPGTFAFAAGGAVKYPVGKFWYVHFAGEYFNSTPKWKFTYNPNLPGPGSEDVAQKRPQHAIRILTGMGVYFF